MSYPIYKPVTAIKKTTKPARGGLWAMYYCPLEKVVTIPSPALATGKIDALINVAAWYKLSTPHYKRGYREEPRQGDGGPFLEMTVTAFVPFEAEANHQTLDRMKYHRYILIVVTPSGMVKLLGNMDNPVVFSQATNSGEDPKDTEGTTVTFSWSSVDKPILYTNSIQPIIQ